MKKSLFISALVLVAMVSCKKTSQSPFEWNVTTYAEVDIEAPDLSGISDNGKEVLNLYRFAADEVDAIYWEQYFGNKQALLDRIKDPAQKTYVEINYGPWDRLNGKSFIDGIADRSPGVGFYPADMTAEEFNAYDNPDKNSPYTLIRRAKDGTLENVKKYEPLFEGRLFWSSERDKGIYIRPLIHLGKPIFVHGLTKTAERQSITAVIHKVLHRDAEG